MNNASSWSSGRNVRLWRQPSGFESYLGLTFFCKQDTQPVFFNFQIGKGDHGKIENAWNGLKFCIGRLVECLYTINSKNLPTQFRLRKMTIR